MSSPAPAMQDQPRLAVVHGEAAVLDGQWASDHWTLPLGPARRGRGTARFGAISHSGSVTRSSADPGSAWRPDARSRP